MHKVEVRLYASLRKYHPGKTDSEAFTLELGDGTKLGDLVNQLKIPRQEIGVLMINLDNFKDVNDTLGHATGDLLLQSIAQRLQKRIRKSDTVARLGGDEFVLIFENVNGHRDSSILAKKILNVFSKPFELGEHQLTVKASIGISLYPQDGQDVEMLFKQADKAQKLKLLDQLVKMASPETTR